MNSIDIKSLLIGILLTSTLFLATGWAKYANKGEVQKVELVGISDSPSSPVRLWETIPVQVKNSIRAEAIPVEVN